MQQKLAGNSSPFGGDMNAVTELNMQAARTWKRILENYSGNSNEARRGYLMDRRLGKSREQHQSAQALLSELKSSIDAYLTTSIIDGPGLYKNYALIPHSLPMHPLLVQLLVEIIGNQSVYSLIDDREVVRKNMIWEKVDGKAFHKELFNQDLTDWQLQNDTSLLNGRWVPVLTGPKILRNSLLLLGLHSARDPGQHQGNCSNWGLFPTSNYEILFYVATFAFSFVIGSDMEIPPQIRSGYRLSVGDLREISSKYVYDNIASSCPRIPVQSFAYQQSSKIIKNYRDLWNALK